MTEYHSYRCALAERMHRQGKSPAEIRKALAEVDETSRKNGYLKPKQQPTTKGTT